ncbi:MAG TPA: hypothetical protein VNJ53_06870 [Gaiellaceae bacterium]|nr:hypothetical protein [Gaiellaceae bacterium]
MAYPGISSAAQALTELLLRRVERDVGQVDARTRARQTALEPYAARAAGYLEQAQDSERALGSAVSSSLTGLGRELGWTIEHALAGIQAPAASVSEYGQGTAQTGAAAGQTVGALSSAELGRLRGFQTAEEVYAAALPRLAALAGEQERRNLLAQARQDLADLSLREAAEAQERAFREREFAYRARQDALDRRFRQTQFRYETRQDRLDRRRQARLDRLAEAAARREYGLDLAEQNELRPAPESVNRSAGYVMGYDSSGRLVPMRGPDGKPVPYKPPPRSTGSAGKGGDDDRADYFYEVREDAFARARALREAGGTSAVTGRKLPLPREQAAARLWAEFGRALVGRGYPRKAVQAMLNAALEAAGY